MTMNFFTLGIFVTAATGAGLAGISCGLVGAFVMRMNLSSLGFTMSHAAFAGAALGLVLGTNSLYTAIGLSLLVAALLGPVAEKSKLPANVIMGITFPLSMGLAFVFLHFAPETAMSSKALSLLWGSILAMTGSDVVKLALLSGITILIIGVFFKEFEALTFDRKLAESSGINTRPFYYALLFLTGLTVSLSLKLVGGLLVFALLVTPSSVAYQFFYDMRKIALISPLLGALFSLSGMVLSFGFDLPVGASIALVASSGFGFSVLVSPKRQRGSE